MSLDSLKNIKYPFRNRDRHIENSRELFLVGRRGQSVKALEPDLKIGVGRIYLRLVVSPRYLNRQYIMFLLWSARVAPHSISRELCMEACGLAGRLVRAPRTYSWPWQTGLTIIDPTLSQRTGSTIIDST